MKKKRAYGSRLSYSLDAGVTYTFVTDMRLITPPKESRGKVEITTLESPNEGDEQMPGMQKSSDIKCEAFYHPTRYTTLRNLQKTLATAFDTDNPPRWKIEAGLGYGQSTRDAMVSKGFLTDVNRKELKNEDVAEVIEFSIQESDCGRTWAEGA